MVIKEMSMHMASPEAAFQAISSEECARELYNWQSRSVQTRNITFREVVESFCRSSIPNVMQRCFADLGPLNLFAVVSGTFKVLRPGNLLIRSASFPRVVVPAPKLIRWPRSASGCLQRIG
jgi:hypothetical protein